MCVQPGRALSQTKYGHKQNDWPETTQKANPTSINPETASHKAEQFSWVPYPAAVCSSTHLQKSLLFCQYAHVSSDDSFFFFFGCVGSSSLHTGFSLVASRGYSSLRCAGFSLRWLLLLWSMVSRCTGFSSCGTWAQQLWLAGSRAQAQ